MIPVNMEIEHIMETKTIIMCASRVSASLCICSLMAKTAGLAAIPC